MARVTRALISVSDKTDDVAFAKGLAALDVEIVSTGGTADVLSRAGLSIKRVEEFTGFQEILEGRVKTLHPKIHGGILAKRGNPKHLAQVGAGELIDLVAVNLYPFAQTIARPGVTLVEAVEQIDIGGVTLLRAAAKNFAHVGVVCDPRWYPAILDELRAHGGALPEARRRAMAMEAFRATADYDAHITGYLQSLDGAHGAATTDGLPDALHLSLAKAQGVRYGENPHQQGAFYRWADGPAWGLASLRQLHGKELSYNNVLDLDAAWRAVCDFAEPAVCVVKHASPCGLACDAGQLEAYTRAWACDPLSAFGGVIGVNRPLEPATAEAIVQEFVEVVVAPSVTPKALAVLQAKKALRVIELPTTLYPAGASTLELRSVLGGCLAQAADRSDPIQSRVVTKRPPTDREREALTFAWRAVKHVKSNAVVIAHDRTTVGIGSGQPSRVDAVAAAVRKAGDRARGGALASEAFFPWPDGVETAAKAGVTAIIQPGGSMRDPEVITAADAAGLAMIFTGVRHFKH